MSEEENKAIEQQYNSLIQNAKANWIYEDYEILLKFQDLYKQQQKEIILLKIEKLKALKQYKECHLSQIPDTANIYYSMKLELEAIDEEISNLMRIWENY